jgi:UDP-N-acetylmuramate dehydrogenase
VTALDPRFIAGLCEAIRGQVRQDVPLAGYSTFRIGGPGTVVLPDTPEDVAIALRHARDAGVPWLALGLGSNVLLPDSELEALVIRLGKGIDSVRSDGGRWWFGAGLPAPLAARETAAAGYGGLHKMVGVPGTVGGGVFMNAGCHGAEWADVVQRVTVVDASGRDRVLDRGEVAFSYRRSGLGKVIVLGTEVVLDPADPELLQQEVQDLFEWRQRGTPFNQPCCGSTFTNPTLPPGGHPSGFQSAGQFLDAAGLKGYTIGKVQVSPLHANYFVNLGGGTSEDVRRLIEHSRDRVQDQFDVRLELEVKVISPTGEIESTDGAGSHG